MRVVAYVCCRNGMDARYHEARLAAKKDSDRKTRDCWNKRLDHKSQRPRGGREDPCWFCSPVVSVAK